MQFVFKRHFKQFWMVYFYQRCKFSEGIVFLDALSHFEKLFSALLRTLFHIFVDALDKGDQRDDNTTDCCYVFVVAQCHIIIVYTRVYLVSRGSVIVKPNPRPLESVTDTKSFILPTTRT